MQGGQGGAGLGRVARVARPPPAPAGAERAFGSPYLPDGTTPLTWGLPGGLPHLF